MGNDFIERASVDEFFMGEALATSWRSSCLKFNTGAVIVDPNTKRIISKGYNGAPRGVESCYSRRERGLGDNACYKTEAGIADSHKNSGRCEAIHAEENAIIQTGLERVEGKVMYSLLFPCRECARKIANTGLIEVVYSMDYVGEEREDAEAILDGAGIKLRRFELPEDRAHELVSRTYLTQRKRLAK